MEKRIEMLEQRVDLLTELVDGQNQIINCMMREISLISDSGKLTNKRIDSVVNTLKIFKKVLH